MKIGIIGASLAGLVAGEKLAKAGHNVTVIANDYPIGGHLATHYIDGGFFDYGLPFLMQNSGEDTAFAEYLKDLDLLHLWMSELPDYDCSNPYKLKPYIREDEFYACESGLSSLVKPLQRWVDIKETERAGGLTYFGHKRGKKRPWMINLSGYNVFECDAVILAVSAVEAYGFLQTAQDETASLRLIRKLDEIKYNARYVLMAAYDHDIPEWKALECKNSRLSLICNDSTKGGAVPGQTNITLHSSDQFTEEHIGTSEEEIKELLLEEVAKITKEPWVEQPEWNYLYRWNYYEAINPIDDFYMELEMEDAPLALTGNYFKGNTVGAEYLSANKLSNGWIKKFENTVTVNN